MGEELATPEPALLPEQIDFIVNTLRECFHLLGFRTLRDPSDETRGVYGIYLMAHERDEQRGLTDSDCWFRLEVTRRHGLGQVSTLDFKAGPNFWLQYCTKSGPRDWGDDGEE